MSTKAGANNPLAAAQQITASQTSLIQDAEKPMLDGFQTAADMVTKFNKALEGTPEAVLRLKGIIQGFNGGTNGAPGTAGAGILSGVKDIAVGAMAAKGLKTVASAAGKAGKFGAARLIGAGLVAAKLVKDEVSWVKNSSNPNLMPDPSQSFMDVTLHGTKFVPRTSSKGGGSAGFGASFGGAKSGGAQSPIPGVAAGTGFGAKDSNVWKGSNGKHTGQDYPVPVGTPVQAVRQGLVLPSTGSSKDLGIYVHIDHQDGFETIYGHLSSKSVSPGMMVTAGQVIGKSGDTGNTTGPHLHFEVRKGKNNPVDPTQMLGNKATASQTYTTSTGTIGGSTVVTGTNNNFKTVLGTGSKSDWATKFLTKLGKPVTDANLKAMTTWMAYEGGHWKNSANYNPLNTTQKAVGASSMNSVGVKSYQSWDQGFQATVDTINNGRYKGILKALSAGNDTNAVLSAVNKSPWGTHIPTAKGGGSSGYGASVPGVQGGGDRIVHVNLTIDKASEEDAILFAKKVKSYLEDDSSIRTIGMN